MGSGHREILGALAARLPDGPALFVNRPNSLLHAILCHRGWPAERIEHALPESLVVGALSDPADADTLVLPAANTVIAGAERRYVCEDGRELKVDTLDRLFAPLHRCALLAIGASDDALGILKGGTALIVKCRPVIFGEVAADEAGPILAWLGTHGYATVIDRPREPGLDRLHDLAPTRLIGAIADEMLTVSDWIRMSRASQGAGSDRFSWRQSLSADVFGQGGDRTPDVISGHPVHWTGPRRSTRLRLWVPCAGSYRITVRLVGDPAIPEPDRFIIGKGQDCDRGQIDTDGAFLLWSRSVEVGARDVAHGLTVSLTAKDTVWRSIGGQGRRVGLAMCGIELSLLR